MTNSTPSDLIEVMNALGPVSDYRDPRRREEVWRTLETAMEASRIKLDNLTSHQKRFLYVLDICDGLLLVSRSRSDGSEARCHTPAENMNILWLITEWIKYARQKLEHEDDAEL